MATKNRAAMLGEAGEERPAQDLSPLGASGGGRWKHRPGTRDLVEGFSDPRIKYLRNDGAGAAAARNLGIARAAGALIAYLDSDNRWTAESSRRWLSATSCRPAFDLAYCSMRLELGGGCQVPRASVRLCRPGRVNYIDLNAILPPPRAGRHARCVRYRVAENDRLGSPPQVYQGHQGRLRAHWRPL